MKEMLYLENVCLGFDNAFSMKNLSFQVSSGEIFGFLGPSGAGKTTTIKLLTRQLVKDSGTIRILGKNVSEVTRADYDRIGILSDMSGLYERMTIEGNLNFFAELRGASKSEVTELLQRMHLYEKRKTMIKKCSKGMRQRTVLAAAILHKPELVFLDEPTSGLDPATIIEVHKMLLDIKSQGTTIFLTTHNMDEADKLCDRIGILNAGQLVTIGSPQELKLRYAKNEVEILTTDKERLTLKKDADCGQKLKELLDAGQLLTVHSKEPNLEEVFIELTGREF